MEFKGTKGKWEFVNTELVDFHLTTIICEKEVIAHINSEKSNRIANALLISKAPEMLEMLKNISTALEKVWYEEDGDNVIFDEINAELLDNLIKSATSLEV